MLPELLTAAGAPRLEQGRCLRARFSRSACQGCAAVCPQGAIDCSAGVPAIREGACTGCSLCQAACPTGALGDSEVLHHLLAELEKVEQPVVGCSQPGVRAHARISCLGRLDRETLLALVAIFPDGLTFNLSRCADCGNSAAAAIFGQRLADVARLPEFPAGRLRLAQAEAEVPFREEALSRREFFTFFRHRSAATARTALRRLQPPLPESYGAKRLPAGRRLLLRTLPLLPLPLRSAAEETFFPTVTFGPECRSCTGCVGVCPTGALTTSRDDPPRPVFGRHLCTGCAACIEFCRHQAAGFSTSGNPMAPGLPKILEGR